MSNSGNYLAWKTLPANTSGGLPVLRFASSLSLTGTSITSGTPNFQSVQLIHKHIAEQGGIVHQGMLHAMEFNYISDDSSANLVYSLYRDVVNGSLGHIDMLFAPHTSTLTLPALAAIKSAEIPLVAFGSSSTQVFDGRYDNVWGTAALGNTWMQRPLDIFLQLPNLRTAAVMVRVSDTFSNSMWQEQISVKLTSMGIMVLYKADIPLELGAGAAGLQDWMTDTFQDPTFPQSPDFFLLLSSAPDMYLASLALATSQRTPRYCLYNQFFAEDAPSMIAQEGWLGTFTWHSSLSLPATLPGVLFSSGDAFRKTMIDMFPSVVVTPAHAQQVGTLEMVLAALHIANSTSPADIRAALLALRGRTFFSDIALSPVTGANPVQNLQLMQAYNGKAVPIEHVNDIVAPQWSWTITHTYTQTDTQKAIQWLAVFAMVALTLVMGLLFRLRTNRLLFASSPTMLSLCGVGGILLLVSSVLRVQTPSPGRCVAADVSFHLGFVCAVGVIVLKSWRVVRIFTSHNLQLIKGVSNLLLCAYLFILLAIDAVLLVVRAIVAPTAVRATSYQCELDLNASTLARRIHTGLTITLTCTKGLLTVAAIWTYLRVRKLPRRFHEGPFFAVVVWTNVACQLVWLVISLGSISSLQHTLLDGGLTLLACSVGMSVLMLPKLRLVLVRQGLHAFHNAYSPGRSHSRQPSVSLGQTVKTRQVAPSPDTNNAISPALPRRARLPPHQQHSSPKQDSRVTSHIRAISQSHQVDNDDETPLPVEEMLLALGAHREELDRMLVRGVDEVATAEDTLRRKCAMERALFESYSDAQYNTQYVEEHAEAMSYPQRWKLMRELIPVEHNHPGRVT
jgi:ABC-type branched-subunit amino acid transport system substrate-binding protein